jgi:hypothetical protein
MGEAEALSAEELIARIEEAESRLRASIAARGGGSHASHEADEPPAPTQTLPQPAAAVGATAAFRQAAAQAAGGPEPAPRLHGSSDGARVPYIAKTAPRAAGTLVRRSIDAPGATRVPLRWPASACAVGGCARVPSPRCLRLSPRACPLPLRLTACPSISAPASARVPSACVPLPRARRWPRRPPPWPWPCPARSSERIVPPRPRRQPARLGRFSHARRGP